MSYIILIILIEIAVILALPALFILYLMFEFVMDARKKAKYGK